jgi:hypothetical protein
MTDRKKPGVAFWATVALVVVLVGYPLSFGPACWLMYREMLTPEDVYCAYRPVISAAWSGPSAVRRAVFSYAKWCGGDDAGLVLARHLVGSQ